MTRGIFIRITTGILVVTATAKLFSAMGDVPILSKSTAVFAALTYRQILVLAAMFEGGVAAFLLSDRTEHSKTLAILWASSIIGIYRFGSWLIQPDVPCPCLGNLTGWIGLSPKSADRISLIMLLFMLLGSFVILATARSNRIAIPTSPVP